MSAALRAWKEHWPEYLMEASALGLFMLSAVAFGALLELPSSPVRLAIGDAFARRALMGVAMGLTAVAIIYSPFGRRSGAHMNPSVTLAFLRMRKIAPADALFYVLFQFLGGVAGVLAGALLIGAAVRHPSVNWVVTVPGERGALAAFGAEAAISFALMLVVLWSSNVRSLARFTGLFAGCLVAAYIAFEAPLSGMSMNPARTFGSALPAGEWSGAWIYFTAPLVGMLAAAELFVRAPRLSSFFERGLPAVGCAKLFHCEHVRCIHCGANCEVERS